MTPRSLFIGRKNELNRLSHDVFFVDSDSYGFCYSLIGLNGIGKTTLIRKLTEEFKINRPENTFCFSTDISEGISYWMFWARLILQFQKSVTEEVLNRAAQNAYDDYTDEILEIYDYFKDNLAHIEEPEFRSQAIIYLSQIFSYFTEMGIRIIITIDEFDRAADVFEDGQFFQYLYGLTKKGALTPLNLSIVTISRRRVSTVAHHMQEGSNFEDAYPPLALKGFNDAELEQFFATFDSLPCGLLSEKVKKEILYLCGRSPGLLTQMRHEFEFLGEQNPSIAEIYAEHGSFIKNSYSRMITLMTNTYANRRTNTKPLLEVFIQKFIGPAYDDNFDVILPLLYDYGFVTKGTPQSNIFLMSGVQTNDVISDKSENGVIYEPITPYFIEYIKNTIIPNDLSNLSGMLIRAEKLVRELIEREMSRKFPDTWEDIINHYAGKKDYYLETLQVKALQNDFSASNISKLNVISFKEYYYIINDYWNIFSNYFNKCYSGKNELFAAMSLLSESRNDSAHLNLVIYNGENRRKLRDVCSAFIDCIYNCLNTEEKSNNPSEEQINKLTNATTTVTFCCQAIKMPKGNLRGIIKENGFSAGIAKRNLDEFAFSVPPKVGDEFQTVVERWDSNAQMFNLRAPDQ